jgi:hypothetical protein
MARSFEYVLDGFLEIHQVSVSDWNSMTFEESVNLAHLASHVDLLIIHIT